MIFPFRPIQSISNRDGRSFPLSFFFFFVSLTRLSQEKKRELPSWDKVELGEGFLRERKKKGRAKKSPGGTQRSCVSSFHFFESCIGFAFSGVDKKPSFPLIFKQSRQKKSNMAAKEGAPPDHYRIFELCARADKRFDK